MKKLLLASAAIVAGTLISGDAFAISAGASKTIHAPSATVKVGSGCDRPCHDHASPTPDEEGRNVVDEIDRLFDL